jgi:hypothetical protein
MDRNPRSDAAERSSLLCRQNLCPDRHNLSRFDRRAPQIEVATEGKAPKEVINIMAALKESMQARGLTKVRDAVRRRLGKPSKEKEPSPRASRPRPSPSSDGALSRGAVSEARLLTQGRSLLIPEQTEASPYHQHPPQPRQPPHHQPMQPTPKLYLCRTLDFAILGE